MPILKNIAPNFWHQQSEFDTGILARGEPSVLGGGAIYFEEILGIIGQQNRRIKLNYFSIISGKEN